MQRNTRAGRFENHYVRPSYLDRSDASPLGKNSASPNATRRQSHRPSSSPTRHYSTGTRSSASPPSKSDADRSVFASPSPNYANGKGFAMEDGGSPYGYDERPGAGADDSAARHDEKRLLMQLEEQKDRLSMFQLANNNVEKRLSAAQIRLRFLEAENRRLSDQDAEHRQKIAQLEAALESHIKRRPTSGLQQRETSLQLVVPKDRSSQVTTPRSDIGPGDSPRHTAEADARSSTPADSASGAGQGEDITNMLRSRLSRLEAERDELAKKQEREVSERDRRLEVLQLQLDAANARAEAAEAKAAAIEATSPVKPSAAAFPAPAAEEPAPSAEETEAPAKPEVDVPTPTKAAVTADDIEAALSSTPPPEEQPTPAVQSPAPPSAQEAPVPPAEASENDAAAEKGAEEASAPSSQQQSPKKSGGGELDAIQWSGASE